MTRFGFFLTQVSCRWNQFLSEPFDLTSFIVVFGVTAGIAPLFLAQGSTVLGPAGKCCPVLVQADTRLGSTAATAGAT